VFQIAAHDPAVSPWLSATAQLLVAEGTSRRPGSTVVIDRLADVLFVHALRTAIDGNPCSGKGLRALADPPIARALSVGEPPLEYLAGWRMTKAAQLLRESDDSTSEVAARVGYQSDAAFNRAFKRWEGKGPGAYRRAHSRLAARNASR
jgi:hypothetical protein